MPLDEVLQTLMTTGLLSPLAPKPLLQVVHPHFLMDLHCAYHQGPGHTTNQCIALRHVVYDLIDQGIMKLGQPSVSSNPLLTYSTHVVPPPMEGIILLILLSLIIASICCHGMIKGQSP